MSGYDAESTAGLHIKGPDSASILLLKQSGCRTVMNEAFHDVGIFRRGADTWLVFGAVYAMPASAQAPKSANRALQLAYGPKSAEEVVRGWLDSPGHCENIMDPRFG